MACRCLESSGAEGCCARAATAATTAAHARGSSSFDSGSSVAELILNLKYHRMILIRFYYGTVIRSSSAWNIWILHLYMYIYFKYLVSLCASTQPLHVLKLAIYYSKLILPVWWKLVTFTGDGSSERKRAQPEARSPLVVKVGGSFPRNGVYDRAQCERETG
eukprot:SAG31_NODE_5415_length_2550_cov_1.529172_1_plen_161_part_10